MTLGRERRQARPKHEGLHGNIGLIFEGSESFEAENPRFDETSSDRVTVTEQSSIHSCKSARVSFREYQLSTPDLSWLAVSDWETSRYSQPFPALVLNRRDAEELAASGRLLAYVPWPDIRMSCEVYCNSVLDEDFVKIKTAFGRVGQFIRASDHEIDLYWGGEDDPVFEAHIPGNSLYSMIADANAYCRSAIFDHTLDAVDFTNPIIVGLPGAKPTGPAWACTVRVRFSPFFRVQRTHLASSRLGLLDKYMPVID